MYSRCAEQACSWFGACGSLSTTTVGWVPQATPNTLHATKASVRKKSLETIRQSVSCSRARMMPSRWTNSWLVARGHVATRAGLKTCQIGVTNYLGSVLVALHCDKLLTCKLKKVGACNWDDLCPCPCTSFLCFGLEEGPCSNFLPSTVWGLCSGILLLGGFQIS